MFLQVRENLVFSIYGIILPICGFCIKVNVSKYELGRAEMKGIGPILHFRYEE